MKGIQKFIKKREQIDENFSRGFLYYCMEIDTSNTCSLDEILKVADEIKKDFPKITSKHIGVRLPKEGKIILYFLCFEIPNNMHFETFEG